MNKFMGTKEAAEYLDVAVPTIYGWVHRKQIPFHKVRNLVKFKKNEIDLWVAKNTKKRNASVSREEIVRKAFN